MWDLRRGDVSTLDYNEKWLVLCECKWSGNRNGDIISASYMLSNHWVSEEDSLGWNSIKKLTDWNKTNYSFWYLFAESFSFTYSF